MGGDPICFELTSGKCVQAASIGGLPVEDRLRVDGVKGNGKRGQQRGIGIPRGEVTIAVSGYRSPPANQRSRDVSNARPAPAPPDDEPAGPEQLERGRHRRGADAQRRGQTTDGRQGRPRTAILELWFEGSGDRGGRPARNAHV
jgi:hypothetical protein